MLRSLHLFFPPQTLETQIEELPASCTVGSILYETEQLKLSLIQECRAWKRAFGSALNRQASAHMVEIYSFVDGTSRQLQRPVRDLEDVRGSMAVLREIREGEIRIDGLIGPVEESFALLNRHELHFADGNAEKVDSLTYAWKNLNALVRILRLSENTAILQQGACLQETVHFFLNIMYAF